MNNSSTNVDFKPYFKLKQQECIIEKSFEALMVNSKGNIEFWNSIKPEIDKLEDERNKLEESLKGSVSRIYEELKSVKEMISPENVKTIDLDLFKKKLQTLWKKLQDFKETCKPAEDLTAEQATLETDLNVLMRQIRKHKDFSNVRDSTYKVAHSKKAATQNENVRKEEDDEREEDFTSWVARYGKIVFCPPAGKRQLPGRCAKRSCRFPAPSNRKMVYDPWTRYQQAHSTCRLTSEAKPRVSIYTCYGLANTFAALGHTGTWSEEDHFLFAKLRKKHKNISSLIQAIQAKCPDLTNESIVNHDAWYRTYLELREKQRKSVQEWREKKEAERKKMMEQRPKMVRAESAPEVTERSPREKAKTSSSVELHVKVDDKKVDMVKKKEMVRQWREQRDKMRMEEEERMRERTKAREEEKESKRKARDARLKKILAVSKEKKVEEKEPSGENVPPLSTNVILQAYRAKDQEFIERRKNILLSKTNTPKQCIPAIQYNFSKIYKSTFMNETKAWQEKQRAVEPKVMNSVNYIKDLPKRAMATWKSYEISDSTSFRQRY